MDFGFQSRTGVKKENTDVTICWRKRRVNAAVGRDGHPDGGETAAAGSESEAATDDN